MIASHDCQVATDSFASKLCTFFVSASVQQTFAQAWHGNRLNHQPGKNETCSSGRTLIQMTEITGEPSMLHTSTMRLIHTSASYVTTVWLTQGPMGFARIAVAK